jgi:hypothetical protein
MKPVRRLALIFFYAMVGRMMTQRMFLTLTRPAWQGGRPRDAASPGTLDFLSSAR